MAADFAKSDERRKDSQHRGIKERGKDKTSVSLLTFKRIIYIRLNIIIIPHTLIVVKDSYNYTVKYINQCRIYRSSTAHLSTLSLHVE